MSSTWLPQIWGKCFTLWYINPIVGTRVVSVGFCCVMLNRTIIIVVDWIPPCWLLQMVKLCVYSSLVLLELFRNVADVVVLCANTLYGYSTIMYVLNPNEGCSIWIGSDVLSRTSSHMCGRCYLPMFLFRDGSLTLMNIASLTDLASLVLHPHSDEILNSCGMTCGVIVVMDRWGGLQMFFIFFIKCSSRFTNLFFFTVHPATLVSTVHSTFLEDGIFVLWDDKAMFAADYFVAFTNPFSVWHHYVCVLVPSLCQLFLVLSELLWIKKAIFKRVADPFLNRNTGKYHLPQICNEVLLSTSELKFKLNTLHKDIVYT